MHIRIEKNKSELSVAAGKLAAELIRDTIEKKGRANIVLATGTSQFGVLTELLADKKIDWSKVVLFHLDEYIDLPISHPASFRKYLTERFISKLPALTQTNLINGEVDPVSECKRLSNLIANYPIDVMLAGIGENGHLAFNDPPADFNTEDAFIVVELDEACQRQQLGEGWFGSLEEVPKKAISMSIKQIVKAKHIICSVPDSRKAMAIRDCFENPVSNLYPASILQTHPNCICFLDGDSAALLSPGNRYIRDNP